MSKYIFFFVLADYFFLFVFNSTKSFFKNIHTLCTREKYIYIVFLLLFLSRSLKKVKLHICTWARVLFHVELYTSHSQIIFFVTLVIRIINRNFCRKIASFRAFFISSRSLKKNVCVGVCTHILFRSSSSSFYWIVQGFADLIFVVESVGITVSRFSQTFTNRMQITAFRSRVRNNTNHLGAAESRYPILRTIILLRKIPDSEELYIQRRFLDKYQSSYSKSNLASSFQPRPRPSG